MFRPLLALFALQTIVFAAELPKHLPSAMPLWEKGAPGSEARKSEAEQIDRANVCNVHNPTITPSVPAAENSTGSAVVICLGGGHSKLCLGHEGYALAEWFKERGIATFVTDKKRTACGHGRTISWPDVF